MAAMDRARRRREEIDRLVREAKERGDLSDPMYWTLVYDFELAPTTTNLDQLAEAGHWPVPPEDLHDDELPSELWLLIDRLAELGIYLLHTDHLADRELYELLVEGILREEVRDLPPGSGVDEFIDLAPVGGAAPVVARDEFLPRPAPRQPGLGAPPRRDAGPGAPPPVF